MNATFNLWVTTCSMSTCSRFWLNLLVSIRYKHESFWLVKCCRLIPAFSCTICLQHSTIWLFSTPDHIIWFSYIDVKKRYLIKSIYKKDNFYQRKQVLYFAPFGENPSLQTIQSIEKWIHIYVADLVKCSLGIQIHTLGKSQTFQPILF